MILTTYKNNQNGYRVWIDELPSIDYKADAINEYVITVPSAEFTEVRRVAVDYCWITGNPWLYGALGGTYIPDESSELRVHLHLADDSGVTVDWARARRIQDTRAGLANAFVHAVLRGFEAEEALLRSGTLTLDHNVHDLFESSEYVFECIARLLIKVMFAEKRELDEETLLEFARLIK